MTKAISLTVSQRNTMDILNKEFGSTVTRSELMSFYKKANGNGILPRWLMSDQFKAGRGMYATTYDGTAPILPAVAKSVGKMDPKKPFPKFTKPSFVAPKADVVLSVPDEVAEVNSATVLQMPLPAKAAARITIGETAGDSLIPEVYSTFVPFGVYEDILSVIRSGIFYPMYVTGLSGNGKSMAVEQACAVLGREFIRVTITPETDEDDLIGGFRLVNGETVWFDGPVVVAARRGAVVLLDEIDYGTGKISCLQSIMEGKGIFLKKVNRLVNIAPGFNIVATGNTKGRGSEEGGGRFMNTQIMNEAFLERFGLTLEQGWPTNAVERKILQKEMAVLGVADDEFAANLVTWADVTRKTFESGASEDVISTRRLSHIVKAYAIFRDRLSSVRKCVSRFDSVTRDGFIELYTKVDANATAAAAPVAPAAEVDFTAIPAAAPPVSAPLPPDADDISF